MCRLVFGVLFGRYHGHWLESLEGMIFPIHVSVQYLQSSNNKIDFLNIWIHVLNMDLNMHIWKKLVCFLVKKALEYTQRPNDNEIHIC